jgi:hypothetical protein
MATAAIPTAAKQLATPTLVGELTWRCCNIGACTAGGMRAMLEVMSVKLGAMLNIIAAATNRLANARPTLLKGILTLMSPGKKE